MRLLILHLSDLHLDASNSGSIIDLAQNIAFASMGCSPSISHVLVTCTGDIVNKGQTRYFEHADMFFNTLQDAFLEYDSGISFVGEFMVPGNHDMVRPQDDMAAYGWTKSHKELVSMASQVGTDDFKIQFRLGLQNDFFEFASSRQFFNSNQSDSKLLWSRRFNIDDCCIECWGVNTSWMCQGEGDQGDLIAFGPDSLDDRTPLFRICLMHHPFDWVHRDIVHKLKKAVSENFSLVLSGHEHHSDFYVRHKDGQNESAFFEADSLSEEASGFAAIVIDLDNMRRKSFPFIWDGQSFIVSNELEWVPMQIRDQSVSDGFYISDNFRDFLEDPGRAQRACSKQLRLNDVFIYPRLRNITLEAKFASGRTIPTAKTNPMAVIPKDTTPRMQIDSVKSGSLLIDELDESPKVLVLGEAFCGKTTLLKKYFLDMRSVSLVPLLLKPDDLKSLDIDKIHKAITLRAEEQYGKESGLRYLRLPIYKRALLVDELHLLHLSSGELAQLFKILDTLSKHVFLFGDELYLLKQIWASFDEDKALDYQVYRLLELDHKQIREISSKIQQCFGAIKDEDENGAYLAKLEQNVKAIIGDNIVIPYPGEVTMILKDFLSHEDAVSHHGAYGFYYDAQLKSDITAALRSNVEVFQPQADLLEAFLTDLSWDLFNRCSVSFTDDDIDSLISKFREKKYNIQKEGLVKILRNARLVVEHDGMYRFRERYQRLFYIAVKLRNMLNDERLNSVAKSVLTELIDRIHERECADIVLFTVYQSHNPWLMSRLCARTLAIFPNESECDMSSSCFYDLSEDDLAESADDDMEVINEDNVVDEDSHDASEELLSSTLKEMSQAFNTLNILGLALRNYSAEIDLDTRESMVCSGYSLSLRSLSAFSSLIHDGKKELAIIARRHLRVNQLASRSNLASRLMTTCSFGVIRRTTQAFASPHLELLLRDIWQKDSRTAVLLLRFSIMLDLRKAGAKEAEKLFQKLNSNPCARAVLGYVVANHLRSFRASEERRLALCNAVKIDPNNPMLIYTKEKPRFVGDKRYAHTDTSIGKRKRN